MLFSLWEASDYYLLKYISVPRIILLKGRNSDTVNDRCWGGEEEVEGRSCIKYTTGRGNKLTSLLILMMSHYGVRCCHLVAELYQLFLNMGPISLPRLLLSVSFQARILSGVTILPQGSFWPKHWTHDSCTGRWILATERRGQCGSRNAEFISMKILKTSERNVTISWWTSMKESYL